MHQAGAASWRFATGMEQLPLVALIVRDTMNLRVAPAELVPPRLDAALADRSGVLTTNQRASAGAQWADWWSAVLAHDVRGRRGASAGLDAKAWRQQSIAEATALFDPPEFAPLADRPELRTALRASFQEALRSANRLRGAVLHPPAERPAGFDDALVREVAQTTAHRHDVALDQVDACAVLLPVAGRWWRSYAPGVVVCSVHAATDPVTARDALTTAFESGLTG